MGKLAQQDGGLDRIEAGVVADRVIKTRHGATALPIIGVTEKLFRQRVIFSKNKAAVAVSSQILARAKAKETDIPNRPGEPPCSLARGA